VKSRSPGHPDAGFHAVCAPQTGGLQADGWNVSMMLHRRSAWLVVLLLLIYAGCASLDVKTEHHPSADFSRYKTFSFADPADIGEARTADEAALQDRIEPAISKQLRAKGLRQLDQGQPADLAVYYWVNVQSMQRRAWRSGYGGGPTYGGSGRTHSFREGTLVLDLVEPAENELAWRATIIAPLRGTRTENLDLAVEAASQAFADYPSRKGSP